MMQIYFERTGGVSGMRLTVKIDARVLSPEEAHKVREMVEAAEFFELPAVMSVPAPGADRFQYTLTVEADGQRHTVRTNEAAVPAALRPLLEWLTNAARKARRGSGMR